MNEFLSKLTKGLSSTTRLTWHRSDAARGDDEMILQNSNNPGKQELTDKSYRKFSQGEHGTVYICVMGV